MQSGGISPRSNEISDMALLTGFGRQEQVSQRRNSHGSSKGFEELLNEMGRSG